MKLQIFGIIIIMSHYRKIMKNLTQILQELNYTMKYMNVNKKNKKKKKKEKRRMVYKQQIMTMKKK